MNINETFSERLIHLRNTQHISIPKMARALGVKNSSVSAYISKKCLPSAVNLVQLADLFGVSIDYLVGRTDEPEINKKV
jgi:transcriptional regulator with XRE-family HTH domain